MDYKMGKVFHTMVVLDIVVVIAKEAPNITLVPLHMVHQGSKEALIMASQFKEGPQRVLQFLLQLLVFLTIEISMDKEVCQADMDTTKGVDHILGHVRQA